MSLAVNGLPSCQLTPWRSGKVSSVPSSLHDQPVARSGTTDCREFCGMSCLNMTRLLNTPIIGRWEKTVASSWIDMLAGLSRLYALSIPPGFCARAGAAAIAANNAAAASARRSRLISVCLPYHRPPKPAAVTLAGRMSRSIVEPEILKARAVEDAVDHQGQPLHIGVPAGRGA